MRKIIVINDTVYRVLDVKEVNYTRVKKGTIERHLKGDDLPEWKVNYKDYHVECKSKEEKFNRTFVFEEQEYFKIFGK